MEQLNLNTILNRNEAEDKLKEILNLFEKNHIFWLILSKNVNQSFNLAIHSFELAY